MQGFVWIALAAVWRRTPGDGQLARDVLASLVIGHVAVSMLFEPDLGSYMRHLSSVALFCTMQFAARLPTGACMHRATPNVSAPDHSRADGTPGPGHTAFRHLPHFPGPRT